MPDPMVDMFVRDVEEGIAGTGVKAAFLKCAIGSPGLTPGVERVMRAKVFGEEGIDPRRMVLGHSGDTTDVGPPVRAGRRRVRARDGPLRHQPGDMFEARADTVVEMCRRGFAESMVLSQDASCYIDWCYTHIHEDVLPYLREHGVTDEQIETMLVPNPGRYFS